MGHDVAALDREPVHEGVIRLAMLLCLLICRRLIVVDYFDGDVTREVRAWLGCRGASKESRDNVPTELFHGMFAVNSGKKSPA